MTTLSLPKVRLGQKTISKKKNIKGEHAASVIESYNLKKRVKRGELVIDVGEDPDNPKQNVTRLRRKWACDELWNRGVITDEQRYAAERYVIYCELAAGSIGKSNIYNYILCIISGKSSSEVVPTKSQHEAYKRLFEIWRELGKFHVDVLNMITLGNMNNIALSKKLEVSRFYISGLIMSVFIRLEEVSKNKNKKS
ncbi:MAG: hypothetical protein ACRCVY_07700 [Commensalibacter sp.]